MIDSEAPVLSVRRQCELLGLNRSSFYNQAASESALNLHLMHLIDEQYLRTPFYGWPKMTAYLRRQGFAINGKRVRRLMSQMGIQAIYAKKKTSSAGKGHKLYPYLLRNLPIRHVNQVWSADITYVPMLRGFMYLVAVNDWVVAVYSLGSFPTPWMAHSVSLLCAMRSARADPRSSTPTRAHSSQLMPSPPACRPPTSRSAWTDAVAPSITSFANAFGAASNMRTSISTSMTQCVSCKLG